ncbi:MAG: CCXG family PEP-CTERM protein [Pseudomonadota bacterium]
MVAALHTFLRHLLVFAGLIAAVFVPAAPASAWDCAWGHRIPVNITNGASAYGDEVRIDLSAADFPAEYPFSTNGEDVRIVLDDDTTPVDHFVSDWNPSTRTATIYVSLGSLAANASDDLYIYIGNGAAVSLGDIDTVFPTSGLRLHSRSTTADPTDAASALAAFAAAATDIYNQIRANVSGQNNRSIGGSNSNFAWCISALIEVTPATTGTWDFRYGADFGRGGHLYVNGVELEAQWNDDLWWANNYNNTAETLEGDIDLTPGWYRYEALGFEGCCDGSVGWQARAPGGPWQDLSTSNFSMRGARCVAPVTVAVSAPESCTTVLNADKQLTVVSDPRMDAAAYAIPGAVILYEISLANPGQAVDADSIALTDALPSQVSLIVDGPNAFELVEGGVPSGLTLNWGGPGDITDDVNFSTDGSDFTYTPMPIGADMIDPLVTHVQFTPSGTFTAFADGTSAPSATIAFSTVVQ